MKANLSKRLSIWVGIPVVLLFGGVIWIASQRSFQSVVEETERYTRSLARYHAAHLDQQLSRAARIPEDLALTLETGAFTSEPALESYLQEMVERTPEIYGSCLAFEPEAFSAGKQLYAPYFYHKDGKTTFEQLGNPEYNYFKWEWYARPRAENRAIWTEPYFDDGGGNTVMTTYSVPIRDHGKFRGIATIDIAMSQLMAEAERLRVGESGYTFIVSRMGKFVAYPDKTKIMRAGLEEMNAELGRRMISGEQGFIRTAEPVGMRPAWIAYTPVQQGQFSLAVVYPEAEVLSQALHLQWELLAMGLLGLLALFAAQVFVARSIARPITELAAAVQQVASGNLDYNVHTHARTTEVRELAQAFRKMTRDLKMRMEELRYTTMVKERFEGELSAARTIQLSLVAKRFPVFPERREIDIHAVLKPARAVGGDFYDFFFIDDDSLCLVAADVAGKGVPAALFMSVSHTLLRANASLAGAPDRMLTKVNDDLCREGSTSGMFVSLAFALLNVRSGELQLCNAGHPAPLRLSRAGAVTPLPAGAGVALGAWPDLRYTAARHQLEPGDTLVFYTDGVTEALNTDEQFYTTDRLEEFLAGFAGQPAEAIARGVVQDVRTFCGAHEQADDLTLLAVRWPGETSFSAS